MGTTSFQPGSVMCALELHSSDICKTLGHEVEALLSEGERRVLPFPREQMRTGQKGPGRL